jgi:hypothetical protein
LISPGGKKIKSLAQLRKKKIAVLADGDYAKAFVRNLLEISDSPDPGSRVQIAPPSSTLDRLFSAGGHGAVIAIAHASTITKDKRYEQYAKRGGFTVNANDESKALVRASSPTRIRTPPNISTTKPSRSSTATATLCIWTPERSA